MKLGIALLTVALLTACGTTPESAPPSSAGSTDTSTTTTTTPEREPHILVLMAEGTGTVQSITCELDGQSTEEKAVALPWRKTFTIPSSTGKKHEWSMKMLSTGKLATNATVDGRLVTQGASNGTGTTTSSLSGSFTG